MVEGMAERDVKKRHILNIDLEEFFPTINFGRVRGMFLSKPYNLPPDMATLVAQICCYKNQLPQGAPTSPIVSNMLCGKLDSELMVLARKYKCWYTRYADDLTFSTNLLKFPFGLAYRPVGDELILGSDLISCIEDNGFSINTKKPLQGKYRRQRVTGLTVNEKANVPREFIRQIRAMIHAWRKHSYPNAESEYRQKYNHRTRHQSKAKVSFAKVLRGKVEYLGMVRGKEDKLYRKYLGELRKLDHTLVRAELLRNRVEIDILAEGSSDCRILKAALRWFIDKREYQLLSLSFDIKNRSGGAGTLKKMCEALSRTTRDKKVIAVFDRDDKDVLREHKGLPFKDCGNNVFSFVIPTPSHRPEDSKISIEYYFSDAEIMTKDSDGRRLFLASEFDPTSGKHLTDSTIHCTNRTKFKRDDVIIDEQVYGPEGPAALAKNAFAQNILDQSGNFANMDFSSFALIFDMMIAISKE